MPAGRRRCGTIAAGSLHDVPLRTPLVAFSYSSFGPGPITPAVKWILIANMVMFVVTLIGRRAVIDYLGLVPEHVLRRGWVWQLGTYMFLHDRRIGHILFNMLGRVDVRRRARADLGHRASSRTTTPSPASAAA